MYGADDGVRTRDPNLGKVVLYQLSHVRMFGGDARIRTGGEGFAGLCLTTWPRRRVTVIKEAGQISALTGLDSTNGADDGVRTRDPNLGKVVLYQLSHVRIARKYITRTEIPMQGLS